MARSSYSVVRTLPEAVFIQDDCIGKSVTNDAERVCRELFLAYGDRRYIYRDTDGQWDELAHVAGRFTGFKPYSMEHFANA
jgi:hypothetical protein